MVPQSKWAHLLQGIVSSLFPKENGLKFPRANGLKFLVETWLLGQYTKVSEGNVVALGKWAQVPWGNMLGT